MTDAPKRIQVRWTKSGTGHVATPASAGLVANCAAQYLSTEALAASPEVAGGPVIVEDPAEAAPLVRSHNNRLVPILFGLAVAAILLSGGGHDSPCNGPDTTPEPGC